MDDGSTKGRIFVSRDQGFRCRFYGMPIDLFL